MLISSWTGNTGGQTTPGVALLTVNTNSISAGVWCGQLVFSGGTSDSSVMGEREDKTGAGTTVRKLSN